MSSKGISDGITNTLSELTVPSETKTAAPDAIEPSIRSSERNHESLSTVYNPFSERSSLGVNATNPPIPLVLGKIVTFVIDSNILIPEELKPYNASIHNGCLKINYDKNKTNLKNIINILNKHKIEFKEINTYEGDLEDVFLKLIRENKS